VMPFYEYKCKDCGRDFEEFQKKSDDPLAECSERQTFLVKISSNLAPTKILSENQK